MRTPFQILETNKIFTIKFATEKISILLENYEFFFFFKLFNQKLTDFSQTKDAIHCKADLRLKYLNPGQKFLQAGGYVSSSTLNTMKWEDVVVRRRWTFEQQLNCWKFFQLLFFFLPYSTSNRLSFHILLLLPCSPFSPSFFYFSIFRFASLRPLSSFQGWGWEWDWLGMIASWLDGWMNGV